MIRRVPFCCFFGNSAVSSTKEFIRGRFISELDYAFKILHRKSKYNFRDHFGKVMIQPGLMTDSSEQMRSWFLTKSITMTKRKEKVLLFVFEFFWPITFSDSCHENIVCWWNTHNQIFIIWMYIIRVSASRWDGDLELLFVYIHHTHVHRIYQFCFIFCYKILKSRNFTNFVAGCNKIVNIKKLTICRRNITS